MDIITVQRISERPLVDVLANEDSLIVIDVSDNNSVKRVLVSELADGVTGWDDILNRPLEFNPSAHTHSMSEIVGLALALAVKLDIADYSWGTLPGKPITFPPDTHAHSIGTVAGLIDVLDSKLAIADYSWLTLPNKPTTFPHAAINWSELQDKPTVFPPNTHTHAISEITGLQATLWSKIIKGVDSTSTTITTSIDNELKIPISGAGWYEFKINLLIHCTPTKGGFRFGLSVSANTQASWNGRHSASFQPTSGNNNLIRTGVITEADTAAVQVLTVLGDFYTTDTVGFVNIQYAQSIANFSTTVKAASWLQYRKIHE